MAHGLKRASAILVCAGLVLLSGCSNCGDWMPLRKGKTWRYLMKDAAEVMQVKCTRRLQVGDSEGWLVTGPGGESAYTWDGCVLRAGRMGAMTFDPPIGVLQGDKGSAGWNYTGTVTARSLSGKAAAKLTQEPAKLEGRYSDAIRVRMVVDLGGNSLEVVTTYARGIGIVEQEQLNNGKTVSRAQLTNDSG